MISKEEFGAWLAVLDFDRMQTRLNEATDEQLDSKWWKFKFHVWCVGVGFTAPPIWTKAGRSYREMLSTLGELVQTHDIIVERLDIQLSDEEPPA